MAPAPTTSSPWASRAVQEPWLDELADAFPGWLLPAAARCAITTEAAARFLSRLSGRADHLRLLQAVSLLVARGDALRRFVQVELPALVRVLPARTQVEQRTWEGGFHGRLDIRATLQLHQAGHPTRFVTRARRRDLALPENVLVKTVALQLLEELEALVDGRHREGWLADLAVSAADLRVLIDGTVLREVPRECLGGHHLRAAQDARHETYHSAAWWLGQLRDAFDGRDPARTAKLLAAGALRPLSAPKRFELAVLVRLVASLSRRLLGPAGEGQWTVEHALILAGRDEVVVFQREDGAQVRVFYDVGRLSGGPRLEGLQHYLGTGAAQRPDIALCRRHPDIPGAARPQDPVIAVDWRRWVPAEVLTGLLDGLDSAGGCR